MNRELARYSLVASKAYMKSSRGSAFSFLRIMTLFWGPIGVFRVLLEVLWFLYIMHLISVVVYRIVKVK